MLLVKMGFFLLSVLLWWVPFALVFISIVELGISVLFGLKGTEWAWNNRSWSSIANFKQTQDIWNKVGLALFILGVVFVVIAFLFFFATLSQYL